MKRVALICMSLLLMLSLALDASAFRGGGGRAGGGFRTAPPPPGKRTPPVLEDRWEAAPWLAPAVVTRCVDLPAPGWPSVRVAEPLCAGPMAAR